MLDEKLDCGTVFGLMTVSCFIIAVITWFVTTSYQVSNWQQESVRKNKAEWVPTKDGSVEWKWKEDNDKDSKK